MRRLGLLVAAGILSATSAFAAPVTFIGADAGASSLATAPNSVAAASAFDAAAAALGAMGLITFETAPLGAINNTSLGGGVSIDDLGQGASITNNSGGSASLFGFNTTSGGQYFASTFPGAAAPFTLVFDFASPIQAFGAYLGGLQGSVVGQQTLVYTSGATFTINIPVLSGGAAFVGFTDAGASISSVRYNLGGDFVTVDDVRYGPTSAAVVPEPASLLMLGAGVAGLVARRRRAAAR